MRLAELTTLRLGGPAEHVVEAPSEESLVAAIRDADAAGEPVLLVAGGSNLVVADAGFAGTVVRITSRGVERDGEHLRVATGEPWEALVARCVQDGLAGFECLSGIPGSVGATPIQNVGAYGQEVAETIAAVRVLDRASGTIETLAPGDCGFGYRTSAFKRDPGRWVVLRVDFELEASPLSQPLRYAELARTLGVGAGDRAPLGAVREAVLALRRAKGMVLDPDDPDTRSAGSFFTNPMVTPDQLATIEDLTGTEPPSWPQGDGTIKTSAAWLIERAGFSRGYGDPGGIAISSKHTLALTNRGAGTAAGLATLAGKIVAGVEQAFAVRLEPEPTLVGLALGDEPAS